MKKFLILLIATLSLAAAAVEYNLESCMFSNGLPLHPKSCESLRQHELKKAAEQKRYKELDGVRRAAREEQRFEAEAKEQDAKREREVKEARYKADEEQRNAMGLKAQQEQIDWEKATAKSAADRTAKQKSFCGDDYRSPKVGMTLARAKDCVADFRLKGQVNRADGVVSTYMAGQTYLHVMDGKIVSWGR